MIFVRFTLLFDDDVIVIPAIYIVFDCCYVGGVVIDTLLLITILLLLLITCYRDLSHSVVVPVPLFDIYDCYLLHCYGIDLTFSDDYTVGDSVTVETPLPAPTPHLGVTTPHATASAFTTPPHHTALPTAVLLVPAHIHPHLILVPVTCCLI